LSSTITSPEIVPEPTADCPLLVTAASEEFSSPAASFGQKQPVK